MRVWPQSGRAAPSPAGDRPARGDRSRLRLVSRTLAAVAAAIAAVAVVGWILDLPALAKIGPSASPMTFNTSVSVLLLALTWTLPPRWRTAVSGLVAALAVATLAEYAAGVSLGIDELVFDDTTGMRYPGRMAIATAVGLLILASSRIAQTLGKPRHAEVGAGIVAAWGSVSLFGYLYGVREMYTLGPSNSIALTTAVALLLLSVALLAGIRNGVFEWVILGPDAGPMLLRRILPVAFIGVPLLGLASLSGQNAGWWDTEFTVALGVVASTLMVTALMWAGAWELSGVDRRRLQAIKDLRSLADELETRVQQRVEQVEAHNARIAVLEDRMQQRVAQVEAHNARIAVLEDRERIASDLHDLVVQQLFAAGMQLQGLIGAHDQEVITKRVNSVVDTIDGAIADLRSSIFELSTGSRDLDVRTATERVVDGASAGLGFKPTLIMDGPVEQAIGVKDDLVAVLREALSNVARHAAAAHVLVRLEVTPEEIRLTVADDGVGIGRIDRESGTAHMRARAAQFGGTCTWRNQDPHGTVVDWVVPRDGDGGLYGDAEDAMSVQS